MWVISRRACLVGAMTATRDEGGDTIAAPSLLAQLIAPSLSPSGAYNAYSAYVTCDDNRIPTTINDKAPGHLWSSTVNGDIHARSMPYRSWCSSREGSNDPTRMSQLPARPGRRISAVLTCPTPPSQVGTYSNI